MKKVWLLCLALLGLPHLSAAQGVAEELREIGVKVPVSSLEPLVKAMLVSGRFDLRGTKQSSPWDIRWRVRFEDATLTMDPARGRINVRALLWWQVLIGSATYTENSHLTIPMIPQATLVNGKVVLKLIPTDVSVGFYNVQIDPIVMDVPLSAFVSLTQGDLIQEPFRAKVKADNLTLGAVIRRIVFTNRAANRDFDGDGISDLTGRAGENDSKAGAHAYGAVWIDYSNNGFNGPDFETTQQPTYFNGSHYVPGDYDGDGKADLSMKTFMGEWIIDHTANGLGATDRSLGTWGGHTSLVLPADFDGDGVMDPVMFDDYFKVDISSVGPHITKNVSGYGTSPVAGDFDGDGKADFALKLSNLDVVIDYSGDGFEAGWDVTITGWGDADHRLVAADYDGDGIDDLALVTPAGEWFLDYAVDGFSSNIMSNPAVSSGFPKSGYGILAPSDYDGDRIADLAVRFLDQWTIDFSSDDWGSVVKIGKPPRTMIDYDRDGKADISELHAGDWKIDYSANGFGYADLTTPVSGSTIGVPADYDGEGRTNLAWLAPDGWLQVQYLIEGQAFISSVNTSSGRSPNAIPVPADYDGDGAADIAFFNNTYEAYAGYVIDYSRNGFFGPDFTSWYSHLPPSDHPTPADYDGDGRADLSLKNDYGQWGIDYQSNGYYGWDVVYSGFGDDTYIPAPADFDGDGLVDLAVMQKVWSGSGWGIDYSANGFDGIDAWYNGYITYDYTKPMPSDYDGDGKADIAVKNDDGYWAIDYAANGFGSWDYVSGGWGDGSAQPFHKKLTEAQLLNVRGEFQFVFELPEDSPVRIEAFSTDGKRIGTLFQGSMGKGSQTIGWSRKELEDKGLKRGLYFLSLSAKGLKTSKKIVLPN